MITKNNSRYWDLEKLYDKYLASGRNPKIGRELDRMYKQAQDEELERARHELIELHKRQDVEKAEKLELDIKKHFVKHERHI